MSFQSDLKYSLDDRILNDYYKLKGATYIQVINDLKIQSQGIDKILHYGNNKKVTIEEKKRKVAYDDFLVETVKNVEWDLKGWLYYTQSDFIVYWIEPLRKIYIIETKTLQSLVEKNNWVYKKPKRITYANKNYKSENIVLQWSDIKKALYKCISYNNGRYETL